MTDICSICYDQLDNSNNIQQCGHKFHLECLMKWINITSTCPLCRYELLNKNKMKIPLDIFLSILSGLNSSISFKEGGI